MRKGSGTNSLLLHTLLHKTYPSIYSSFKNMNQYYIYYVCIYIYTVYIDRYISIYIDIYMYKTYIIIIIITHYIYTNYTTNTFYS